MKQLDIKHVSYAEGMSWISRGEDLVRKGQSGEALSYFYRVLGISRTVPRADVLIDMAQEWINRIQKTKGNTPEYVETDHSQFGHYLDGVRRRSSENARKD